jgi:energy-coupling factor transporter ATP-binding protein EcfA2
MRQIVRAVSAGECAAVIGLSGSGKSNLVGFLANRVTPANCAPFTLVDCNRLMESDAGAFYRLLLQTLDQNKPSTPSGQTKMLAAEDTLGNLERRLAQAMEDTAGVCFLLDRFDKLFPLAQFNVIAGNLRALRDRFKYRLSYVIASRRLPPVDNELSELFFGRTIWLGPLAKSDALWSARRDAQRFSAWGERDWSEAVLERLVEISGGYPSFLRAACEAYSDGAALESAALRSHPAVGRRVDEFLADVQNVDALRASRLDAHPWLTTMRPVAPETLQSDSNLLTAKESHLLEYLQAHPGQVCEKDDLVQAIWPEDVIFERGVRDESLAQLVRRLRIKIEENPGEPQRLITVPGRGYLYKRPGAGRG